MTHIHTHPHTLSLTINWSRDNIGFDERPDKDYEGEINVKVFHTAWGANATLPKYELNGTWATNRPHPKYRDTVVITDLANTGARVPDITKFRDRTGPQGPHPCKVKGKLYWPHMTNPTAHIPVKVSTYTYTCACIQVYGRMLPILRCIYLSRYVNVCICKYVYVYYMFVLFPARHVHVKIPTKRLCSTQNTNM